MAEGGVLVGLQPDAVPEGELKALVRVLPGAGSLGRVPSGFEQVAYEVVELASGDAGPDCGSRPLQRLANERLELTGGAVGLALLRAGET